MYSVSSKLLGLNALNNESMHVPRPQNLVVILSDQHNPNFLGTAGHPVVQTPNLDRLAGSGTRFTRASTPCPICVPARASLATGRYVHEIGAWDNAHPYTGSPRAWGHVLLEQGHRVAAVGKLHYRSDDDDNGFLEKIHIMNVVDGVGDRLGLLRHLDHERGGAKKLALDAGPGESTYTEFDRNVTSTATEWLRTRAAEPDEKPWLLFVGFLMPHLPLISPPEFYDIYTSNPDVRGGNTAPQERLHPWIDHLTRVIPYGKYFDDERRRKALTAYHGMVSFLDHNIGLLMETLDDAGLSGTTRVIYTSDHGEMLGAHGIWGKCCMYEESVSVPMIMSGQDVARGATNATEVSLIDLYPTILESLGAENPVPASRYGRSLFDFLGRTDENRVGFSEYHAVGAMSGSYMIRRGRWKLVYYVNLQPQLFDLVSDPEEMHDLSAEPATAQIRAALEKELLAIVDPKAVSDQAFSDQRSRIAELGGEPAIITKGDFGHTPTPGEPVTYS
ncbi:MAG: sulfatase-like hydrolase/transferase [Rhizobiaceae bacterium]|nr:sulfatase-like hydrolase/transferase [Rhizobiaceae bacterium]